MFLFAYSFSVKYRCLSLFSDWFFFLRQGLLVYLICTGKSKGGKKVYLVHLIKISVYNQLSPRQSGRGVAVHGGRRQSNKREKEREASCSSLYHIQSILHSATFEKSLWLHGPLGGHLRHKPLHSTPGPIKDSSIILYAKTFSPSLKELPKS